MSKSSELLSILSEEKDIFRSKSDIESFLDNLYKKGGHITIDGFKGDLKPIKKDLVTDLFQYSEVMLVYPNNLKSPIKVLGIAQIRIDPSSRDQKKALKLL